MEYVSQKPICISLPGMEIHITVYFFRGVDDRPPRLHTHPCHEIVCTKSGENIYFTVIPPLTEHFSKTGEERMCSFLFNFTGTDDDDICQIIRFVDKETEILDNFDGFSRLIAIKEALEHKNFGLEEQLKAEFRLFFVNLAQNFHVESQSMETTKQTLDDERIALLEEFFSIEMRFPDCNKQQLAAKIGVCERQLTRILKETYNSSFSAILTESRMNMAHAMLLQGVTSISEVAESVGYTSVASFRSAYKKFFGFYPGKN